MVCVDDEARTLPHGEAPQGGFEPRAENFADFRARHRGHQERETFRYVSQRHDGVLRGGGVAGEGAPGGGGFNLQTQRRRRRLQPPHLYIFGHVVDAEQKTKRLKDV